LEVRSGWSLSTSLAVLGGVDGDLWSRMDSLESRRRELCVRARLLTASGVTIQKAWAVGRCRIYAQRKWQGSCSCCLVLGGLLDGTGTGCLGRM
jgi:hypothetical protein